MALVSSDSESLATLGWIQLNPLRIPSRKLIESLAHSFAKTKGKSITYIGGTLNKGQMLFKITPRPKLARYTVLLI